MRDMPAFPVTAENGLGHVSDGMTLRQYYAGQALAGICANPLFYGAVLQGSPIAAAMFANEAADAMLTP